MEIKSIASNVLPVTPPAVQSQSTASVNEDAAKENKNATPVDVFEKSTEQTQSTQSQSSKSSQKQTYYADISRMREIWAEHDKQISSFQKLIESMIQKQADKAQQAGGTWDFEDPNAMVDIDEETKAAAQEAVGEGGYFSAESTASRILDFAVAISGGDPGKISLLRDAVQKGFDGAAKKWGDELPEISNKTHEMVMNGFDEWAKNGSAKDITLLSSSK